MNLLEASRKAWRSMRGVALSAITAGVLAVAAQAVPTIVDPGNTFYPGRPGWVTPHHTHVDGSDANTPDGQLNTHFVIQANLREADVRRERITGVRLVIGERQFVASNHDILNSGLPPYIQERYVIPLRSPVWVLRGSQIGAGTHSVSILVEYVTIGNDGAETVADPVTIALPSPFNTLVVTNRTPALYRSQLWPEDPTATQQDQFDPLRPDPYQPGAPDDGSTSTRFRFRIRYQHPDGLATTTLRDFDFGFRVDDVSEMPYWQYPQMAKTMDAYYPNPISLAVHQNLQDTVFIWIDRQPHFMKAILPRKPTAQDYRNGVLYEYVWEPVHQDSSFGLLSDPLSEYQGRPWSNTHRAAMDGPAPTGPHSYSFEAGADFFPTYAKDNPLRGMMGVSLYQPGVDPDGAPTYPLPANQHPVVWTALAGPAGGWLHQGTVRGDVSFADPDNTLTTQQGPFHPRGFGLAPEISTARALSIPFGQTNYNTLPTSVPVVMGSRKTKYEFVIRYWGRQDPAFIRVVVRNLMTNREKPFVLAPVDAGNTRNGGTYTARVSLDDMVGPNQYWFEANDGGQLVRYPRRSSYDPMFPDQTLFVGPFVNQVPVLSEPSVSPTSGKQGDNYTFRVKYADPDNQRPGRAKLHIQLSDPDEANPKGTWAVVDMIPEDINVINDPSKVNFKSGTYYRFNTASDPRIVLQQGTRHFYFEFTDNWGDPLDVNRNMMGETVLFPIGASADPADDANQADLDALLVGPKVGMDRAPYTLLPETVVGTGDWEPDASKLGGIVKGSDTFMTTATTYTFQTKYVDKDNDAPRIIRLAYWDMTDPDNPGPKRYVNLVDEDPDNKLFSRGKLYSVKIDGLKRGVYYWQFEASDASNNVAFPNDPAVLESRKLIVGENIAPELSLGRVTPETGDRNASFQFLVTYKDPEGRGSLGGDSASTNRFVRLVIDGFEVGVVARVDGTGFDDLSMKPHQPQNPTLEDFQRGVVYQITVTREFFDRLALPFIGKHEFFFIASDGEKSARLPIAGQPSFVGPTVYNMTPTLDTPSLTPSRGTPETEFTFGVTYKHPDGIAPDGDVVKLLINGDEVVMAKVGTGGDYKAGVRYQVKRKFAEGQYTHRYAAVADGSPATGPATLELDGPLVSATQPELSIDAPATAMVGGNIVAVINMQPAPAAAQPIAVTFTSPGGQNFLVNVTMPTTGSVTATQAVNQKGTWTVAAIVAMPGGVAADPVTVEVGNPVIELEPGLDMIALPYIPESGSLNTFFGVDAAAIGTVRWLSDLGLYGRASAGQLRAIAGAAYWIRPNTAVTLRPSGLVADPTIPYRIPLAQGWNMIGTPFSRAAALSNVRVAYNGAVVSLTEANTRKWVTNYLWSYAKANNAYQMISATGQIQPGRGNWIYSWVSGAELEIPAPGAPVAVGLATREADPVGSADWTVRLVASAGAIQDTQTVIGMGSQPVQMLKPAPYVQYVQARIVGSEGSLGADVRRSALSANWDIEVLTDQPGATITLGAEGIARVARNKRITLVDVETGSRHALSTSGYTFTMGSNQTERRFRLEVTPRTNERALVSSLRVSRTRGNAMQINYILSAPAAASIEILDGRGAMVRNMPAGMLNRGSGSITWDGRDGAGASVAAGVYRIRLVVTGEDGAVSSAVAPVVVTR